MRTYIEVLEELNAKSIKPGYGNYYEFDGKVLAEEFQKYFNLIQGFLDRDDLEFVISPARIYFNDNETVNGLARNEEGLYLIEIFKGSITRLYEFYTSWEDVFHLSQFEKYQKLMDKKDISGSYVLFQFAGLYIFYHETGHLIQQNKGEAAYLEFADGKLTEAMSRIRHIREHDADWFAISQVAFHVIQFVNKGDQENPVIDPAELETMAEMALSAIYVNAIRQAEKQSKLYFAEKSHPHPAVRISYLIIYLLDALAENVKFEVNKKAILQNSILLAEALLSEPCRNIVEEFSVGIFERSKEIEDYINVIRNDADTYPHLALKKIKSVKKT